MRASFVALAGTIVAVVGGVLWALFPPIGLFFIAFGAFIALASPVIGLTNWWGSRSTE